MRFLVIGIDHEESDTWHKEVEAENANEAAQKAYDTIMNEQVPIQPDEIEVKYVIPEVISYVKNPEYNMRDEQ